MGSIPFMKTTIDIHDDLLVRAKKRAKETGRPLRSVVEEGLRTVLSQAEPNVPYILEDCSVGQSNDPNPLEHCSWDELRDLIYDQGLSLFPQLPTVNPISAR